VAKLLDGGVAECARKLGEEGVEASLAAIGENDERLIAELADLWFASYVLLAARGLDPALVEDELARRREAS
jgi:phosphoribosyl-ATP pyrophosphohydrolase